MNLKKVRILGMLVLTVICHTVPVYAEDKEIPEIVLWQDGHGYQADGAQIKDSWAYDTVNPAGKYVLFGKDGAVLRKAESQKLAEIEEDYSSTELVPAILAVRADIFEGFQGVVSVLLEEKSGVQKEVELNPDNFFAVNVSVNSGDYYFREVEAWDKEIIYVTEYPDVSVNLPEEGMRVMKIRVTDVKEETVPAETEEQTEEQTEETTKKPQEQAETNGKAEEEKKGEEESKVQENGTKKLFSIFGGVAAVCLAGFLLLCRKRKNYV